ncbi:MAG: gliding motility-associated C-terminal domain-containing protein [Flavobacteriales bacterium]|nr:gliding motility-associated C-terminal domain-containing protein [Flavobacteriales bacterium]
MKKLYAAVILVCIGFYHASAQMTISITDIGPVTLDCGSGSAFDHTFQDDNPSGSYAPNASYEITICPDGFAGSKVSFRATSDIGDTWDIDDSDTLFVYDGPNTGAPLLGAFNNGTNTVGISVQASFNNPTGCLTFVFVSDGAVEGDGFAGITTCGYPCQPFTPIIGSDPLMEPADTGWIDICLGDTVWLNGGANFPYSGTNGGIGYDQTTGSSTFDWEFADGTSFTDEQSVFFVPTVRAGYFVEMRMTDTLGCVAATTTKIRVSTIPNFSETVSLASDTLCFGASTILLGGVTFSDTAGVAATEGSFINGGIFAGLTYLPDGSGVNYETNIEISQFDSGQVVQNASDVLDICVTMEHSFLGDLEMMLTCPNGTSIVMFNAYTGTGIGPQFAGGFGGGGTYLGQALDNGNGTPGTGWEYCFSDNAIWGTMGQEFGAGNTTPVGGSTPGNAMSAGTYLPEQSYDNLIGCPINGTWTITVRDNQGIDDGYIFEWGVLFNPDIDPNAEFYVPSITDGWWDNDPSIINNIGDTIIEVLPPNPGDYFYTFHVTDNFGCSYDTTLQIHSVPPLGSYFDDIAVCDMSYDLTAADYEILGQWDYAGPNGGTASFSPNSAANQSTVTVSQFGEYQFIYTSEYCGQADTLVVDFNPTPSPVPLINQTICPGTDLTFDAGNEDIGANYVWSPGGFTGQVLQLDSITNSGGIQVTVTNDCGTANGAATITVHTLQVSGPLDVCLATEADLLATVSTSGGTWTYTGPTGGTATFSPNEQSLIPSVSVNVQGPYVFTFTDDECSMVKTWEVYFSPAPVVTIGLDTNRICVEDNITLFYTTNTDLYDTFEWGPFGTSADTLVIAGTDSMGFNFMDTLFHVTASISNFCGTDEDEVVYQVIDCNLDVPNVFNPESSIPENQYFNIVALELHPGNNVKIFDRWGRKCYDVDNYHLNPWNGGKEKDGVYYFVLERPGYEAETGYVHLVHGHQ